MWHIWKRILLPIRRSKELESDPWEGKISWGRKWQPTPVFLPGKFHRQRNLALYSPWGKKESDETEYPYTHMLKNNPRTQDFQD